VSIFLGRKSGTLKRERDGMEESKRHIYKLRNDHSLL
jgi:hypothetical protein